MSPELHEHLQQIFNAAIELTGSSRVEYLSRTCQDDADLRAHVEKLIEMSEKTSTMVTSPMTSSQDPNLPPNLGRYELLSQIGSGSMGIVYRARDTTLDRVVALKVMRPESQLHEESAERFRREARACAQLNHPAIVTVYDLGEVPGNRRLHRDGAARRNRLAGGHESGDVDVAAEDRPDCRGLRRAGACARARDRASGCEASEFVSASHASASGSAGEDFRFRHRASGDVVADADGQGAGDAELHGSGADHGAEVRWALGPFFDGDCFVRVVDGIASLSGSLHSQAHCEWRAGAIVRCGCQFASGVGQRPLAGVGKGS